MISYALADDDVLCFEETPWSKMDYDSIFNTSRLLRILRQSRSCNHDREVKKIGLRMTGSKNAGSSGLLVVYIIDDRGFGYQVCIDVTGFFNAGESRA